MTSYKYGDGLIPGRHKVCIDLGSGPEAKSLVPKDYTSIASTPLEVDTAKRRSTSKYQGPTELPNNDDFETSRRFIRLYVCLQSK